MHIDAFGATHNGNIRSHNEDNIYVEGSFRNDLKADNVAITGGKDGRPRTYAVLDGLGGEESGEKASFIGALGLKRYDDDGRISDVEGYVDLINRSVIKEAAKNDIGAMGTTFVMVHIDEYRATIANVGDSRAYILRDESLKQISRDHSVVQSLIDNGFLKESEWRSSPYIGELTQYLGMTSEDDIEPEADVVTMSVLPGDVFLLCSDGLTGELTDKEISDIMLEYEEKEAKFIALMLIKEALKKAGSDNVSAVVCKIVE